MVTVNAANQCRITPPRHRRALSAALTARSRMRRGGSSPESGPGTGLGPVPGPPSTWKPRS
jgi:hypothetical protein